MSCVVAALYKFVPIADPESFRAELDDVLNRLEVRGTVLVASEGINGTVSGSREGIDGMLAHLRAQPGLKDLVHKESVSEKCPFLRTKVRLKKEIVTLGVDGVDPNRVVGTYVDPENWNDLISRDDVLLIDTRNDYEVQVGTFRGALNPETSSFREFPDYVGATLDPSRHRKVAMFCTGGIRCEKATSWMKDQGFEEVYHLKGGILKYLETVEAKESLWDGECFVFDGRVTVDHDLQPGQYEMCHACRMPISEEDMADDAYVPGVSCPHCEGKLSEEDRVRMRERQRQIELAKERGEPHIGGEIESLWEKKRKAKRALKERQRIALEASSASNDTATAH